jgi:hypothetical protein
VASNVSTGVSLLRYRADCEGEGAAAEEDACRALMVEEPNDDQPLELPSKGEDRTLCTLAQRFFNDEPFLKF